MSDPRKEHHPSMIMKTRSSLTIIPWDDILFMEYVARKVEVHMVNGSVYRSSVLHVAFQELIQPLLASGRFVRPHQAFLVAIRAIHSINANDLTLENGLQLPLSKLRRKQLRTAYVALLPSKESVSPSCPPPGVELQSLPCGVSIFRQVGRDTFVRIFMNDTLCNFMNISQEAALRQQDIFWCIHPDDLAVVKELFRLLSTTAGSYRLSYRLKRAGAAYARVYVYASKKDAGNTSEIYAAYFFHGGATWPHDPCLVAQNADQ